MRVCGGVGGGEKSSGEKSSDEKSVGAKPSEGQNEERSRRAADFKTESIVTTEFPPNINETKTVRWRPEARTGTIKTRAAHSAASDAFRRVVLFRLANSPMKRLVRFAARRNYAGTLIIKKIAAF